MPTDVLRAVHVFEWLRELQQEGLIRRWGASVESVEEGLLCVGQPGLASLQVIFNIFRQTPETSGLLDRCKQQGVAIIVRLPLASGLLAGKYTPQTTFGPSDHRTVNRNGENVG